MKNSLNIILSLLIIVAFARCSDTWLEKLPNDALTPDNAFVSIADAEVALHGAYSRLQDNELMGADLITYGDVKGDDCRTYLDGKRTETQYRYLESTESGVAGYWTNGYNAIMLVNNILAKIDDLEALSDEEIAQRNDIKGQALAIRALMHFELVRLYGKMPANGNPSSDLGVPLADRVVDTGEKLPRNTVKEVYDQAIDDLKTAIPLLGTAKNNGYINSWAAKAILSRVYLYNNDLNNALAMSHDVIANSGYALLERNEYIPSWGSGFSSESLFEIVNTDNDNADREAIGYLWDPTGYGAITVTDNTIAMLEGLTDDIRSQILSEDERDGRNGVIVKYPGKDGGSSRINNIKYIRLSEVYLIASEAAVRGGSASGAQGAEDYLNSLRAKRITGYTDVTSVTLDDVLMERRIELIGEGHRFFDIMRNGLTVNRTGDDHLLNATMTLEPTDFRAIMAIPRAELNVNDLIQNDGYAK